MVQLGIAPSCVSEVITVAITVMIITMIKASNQSLTPGGQIMVYTGRLRPKGVPFSGFRYIKGWGFHKFRYMKGLENLCSGIKKGLL